MKHRVAWGAAAVLAVVAGSVAALANSNYWGRVDEPLQWVIFINELATSIALIVILVKDPRQKGRRLGIGLATGLLGAALLVSPLIAWGDPLVFCFALALVVVLVKTSRWNLFWLGMAALWGGILLILRLVGLGISFM